MTNKIIHPPIDQNMLEFKLPSAVVKRFENGLTLIHFHRSDIPKVYFRLGILGGEKMDFSEAAGSVDLMSGMMKKGTKTRTYNEFAEAVDYTGGSLGASASRDFFYGQGGFLSEFAGDGLGLMADMFRNPVFPEEQLVRDRDRSIADLENEKSSSGYIGRKFMTQQLYSPHPYGLSATAETLSSVTAETLSKLHARTIGPKNAFLVITGDIVFEKAAQLAEDMFGDWEEQQGASMDFPKLQYAPDVLLVDRPGSVQSSVSFGVPLFSRTDERYIRTRLCNQILGGGSSGRLFLTLREEKGLTYGAYSSMDVYLEAGGWISSA
ncbi:MAG: pitrilysin family protein, partial [Calditrichota bacterium]